MEESSFEWKAFFTDYLRWCGLLAIFGGGYLCYQYIAILIQKMHEREPKIEIKTNMMGLGLLLVYSAPALMIFGERINGIATSIRDLSPAQYAYVILFVVLGIGLNFGLRAYADSLGYETTSQYLRRNP